MSDEPLNLGELHDKMIAARRDYGEAHLATVANPNGFTRGQFHSADAAFNQAAHAYAKAVVDFWDSGK